MPLVLGLETSCDETAAAVVRDGTWVLSNVVASQHELHEKYRGVVPEIASRAHLENLTPVLREALDRAGVALDDIHAVAVGNRPGLIGSLLVGVSAAKALAWSRGLPLVGVDHVKAHLHAASLRLPGDPAPPHADADFPALGLVVSGGHTTLYLVNSPLEITALGRTIDDAVGEAYDKAAVILGAGYPGGPNLDRLAQRGDASRVDPLPRTMLAPDSLDFSFSGLKTSLLYRVRGTPVGRGDKARFERGCDDLTPEERADLAAAFQSAAVETLITKSGRAIQSLAASGVAVRRLIIGGGVSANSALRRRAAEFAASRGVALSIPPLSLCVDNAAMIAGLAAHQLAAGSVDGLDLPAVASSSA